MSTKRILPLEETRSRLYDGDGGKGDDVSGGGSKTSGKLEIVCFPPIMAFIIVVVPPGVV